MRAATREFPVIRTIILFASIAVSVCVHIAVLSAADETTQAKQIINAAGIQGGLIVHLGCGDGKLTAALHASDGYHAGRVIHGLDPNPANVKKARELIRSLGLCGKVSVDTFDGKHLPYIDNSVNFLVADKPCGVSTEEVMRVLAPNGVAYIKKGEQWTKTIKPWPKEIDEWTHYLHDATNNAVAQDTVVAPPKRYQWIGAPRWLRHHDHMSGLSAMVSAKGRLFYIVDLGPQWSVQMPPKWTLVARDAFNGVILWQRPIKKWHPHLWPLKKGPAQLMRRLVAEGDTVYVTLGVGAPVTALDAATGRILRTYKGTEGAEEMILAAGVLYVVVNPELDAYKDLPRDSVQMLRRAGAGWNWDEKPRKLTAIQADTGKTVWSKQQVIVPCTLASTGGRVYFHDGDKVVCLDAQSGRDIWTSKPNPAGRVRGRNPLRRRREDGSSARRRRHHDRPIRRDRRNLVDRPAPGVGLCIVRGPVCDRRIGLVRRDDQSAKLGRVYRPRPAHGRGAQRVPAGRLAAHAASPMSPGQGDEQLHSYVQDGHRVR